MQPLRSLGRRRRPEISSPLLLSFRASKTSLLVSFYSVYRLLCYLPSLNSFHEILFCGIRMANSGLLKTSSCLVVSGKILTENINSFMTIIKSVFFSSTTGRKRSLKKSKSFRPGPGRLGAGFQGNLIKTSLFSPPPNKNWCCLLWE